MTPDVKALVKQLRDFANVMPDGGSADPFIEVMGSMASQAADAIESAEAKAGRFQSHLMSRPANNAALPQSYVEWNASMYLIDRDGFRREPEELLAALRKAPE